MHGKRIRCFQDLGRALIYFLVCLVPGRSPENVRGVAETSTSIYVHWDEVASNFVHGKLLYYNLTVQQANDKSKSIHKAVKENEVPPYLNDLQKYTEYVIWVRAVNSKGHGKLNSPEGYRVRTKEDGKFYDNI